MTILNRVLTIFKPKPLPVVVPAIADAEFLDAVAKPWRDRYQSQQPKPLISHGQAA